MFKQETPNVMLVVDRSLSMNDAFGAASRWNTVRTALTDPAMGLLPMLETQVRFGLTMYTTPAPMMAAAVPPVAAWVAWAARVAVSGQRHGRCERWHVHHLPGVGRCADRPQQLHADPDGVLHDGTARAHPHG